MLSARNWLERRESSEWSELKKAMGGGSAGGNAFDCTSAMHSHELRVCINDRLRAWVADFPTAIAGNPLARPAG